MNKADVQKNRWQKIQYFMEYGIVPLWIKNCAFLAFVAVGWTILYYLKNPS